MFACIIVFGLSAAAQSGPAPRPQDPVDWVNPYIGTGAGGIGYGGTMPFVTPPFGMTDWTAQTRQNKLSRVSYNYADTTISGFMGTHQPAIWMGDYGYVTVVPELDSLKIKPEQRKLPFSHADEITHPDFYSVVENAGSARPLRTEITATTRCAYMRFTFPASKAAIVMVEVSRPGFAGFAKVDLARREIVGYNPARTDANLGPMKLPNFKGYFVIQFRKAFTSSGVYGPHAPIPAESTGAFAEFVTRDHEQIDVRVGTSFLSIEQARQNLEREIPSWDFDRVRQETHAQWKEKLERVTLEGASEDQRRIVYTALYHALLYPRVFSEYGHYYSAFDDQVLAGQSYTAYSIWDTFRAEFSLLTLLAPERVDGMVTALLQDYKEGGWMPKWPNPSYTNIMIGTHADSLVAEAMRKGFKGFDYDTAWAAVYKDAMTPPDGDTTRRWADRAPGTPYEARGGLTYLKKLGYVPADKTAESASRTLEDSYDDWCVSQIAARLGKTSDATYFLQRAHNYANIFNKATGFMQARNSDGSWAPIDAGWTEGNKWVYTWAVMQDIPGLMKLMGGKDVYNRELDEHFAGHHNIHKNEPSHHYGYLYDYSGEPWKTQATVREIADAEYANLPAGLDGDDDCGQMSAWYLFTAFGFYPVTPASGDYMIGSPIFSRMSLRLANGKQFTVIADNNSNVNRYIQSATLDGKKLSIPKITYEDIMRGSTLRLTMGRSPSTWAADWSPVPLALRPATSTVGQMEFSDAPNFTVAGVTDWTAVGGHGSDATLRTSESLASATASLSGSGAGATTPEELRVETAVHEDEGRGDVAQAQAQVHAALHAQPTATLYRVAAEVDERGGDPLAAVREFEQAAKLDPSEVNEFEWGSELLVHRAIWPAEAVFASGVKAYPRSVRMQTALGAALFAGARYEQAAERLCKASDLAPEDAEPYKFMGKAELAAPDALACVEPHLARYVHLKPGSSEAHYLYAMAILKQQESSPDAAAIAQAEALLQQAVALDAKCSDGYLELGVLAAQRKDLPTEIGYYSKAIDANPMAADAYYRLAKAYERTGQREKAKAAFAMHDKVTQEQAAATERQRKLVKQFLFAKPGDAPTVATP
ncbi:MAG: GH92 family glycosyl hydrolase [Acidobacteriaceae bacterium]